MTLDDLMTPALVLDLGILRRNLAMMQRAIGARVSAPGPKPLAAGIAPATQARLVIRIGRNRTRPVSRSTSASGGRKPSVS